MKNIIICLVILFSFTGCMYEIREPSPSPPTHCNTTYSKRIEPSIYSANRIYDYFHLYKGYIPVNISSHNGSHNVYMKIEGDGYYTRVTFYNKYYNRLSLESIGLMSYPRKLSNNTYGIYYTGSYQYSSIPFVITLL